MADADPTPAGAGAAPLREAAAKARGSAPRGGGREAAGPSGTPSDAAPEIVNQEDVEAPAVRHHRNSLRPLPDVLGDVREWLGPRLTAVIGGVKETRAVREWIEGTREPSPNVRHRIQCTYQITAPLVEQYGPHTAQAWMQGLNPMLGDASPARLIRDAQSDEDYQEVLRAARHFSYGG